MLLQNLSWTGAKEWFAKTDLVILPTGSCEQHGPQAPLGTDFLVAGEISRRVGEKVGCLVAPTVNYGYCPWHLDFPGTISIDEDALFGLYMTISEQLVKWGAKHLMFINGHGGNSGSLDRVAVRMRSRGVLCVVADWWVVVGNINPDWVERGHGGVTETSVVLHLFPDLVNMSVAKPAVIKQYTPAVQTQGMNMVSFRGVPLKLRMRTADVSDVGNYGDDPRLSNAVLGKDAIDGVVDFLADFAKEFVKINIKADQP